MMTNIDCQNGELFVSGTLNFVTVMSIWNQSLPFIQNEKEIQINLEKIQESNGAGLALLVEWKCFAKRHNKIITFKNLPENLLSIANLTGVMQFLT